MRAVQITEFGGPEVLSVTEVPDPVSGDGLQLLEVSSAGVNYADTHQVEDSYLSRTELPLVPGTEVVGRLPDGSRVAAFAMGGGYAEKALVHPAMSFPLPEGVSDGQALSLQPVVGGTYPLSEARRAHEDLRSRASQGKLVLDCTA